MLKIDLQLSHVSIFYISADAVKKVKKFLSEKTVTVAFLLKVVLPTTVSFERREDLLFCNHTYL
jgi:hypothetical protein